MNDFTKEELETLHSCLDQCKFEDGEDDALLEKLEGMINEKGILQMNDLYTGGLTVTLPSNLKMDYTINGFSVKDTIKEVLDLYEYYVQDRSGLIDEIAEAIKEAFVVKLRIKQG
jgi:hypothetical protein